MLLGAASADVNVYPCTTRQIGNDCSGGKWEYRSSCGGQPTRTESFFLFDKQGAFVEAVDNPYKDARNAGIPTLDFLANKGVKVLVAESFGSKIVEVMKDKGIRPVEFKGNARDAIKKALELK